jgi:glycine betaine/proline transport system ATP-binding protein
MDTTQETQKDVKVRAENLVMIFGKDARNTSLPMLQQGETKSDILSKTGHVVGVSDVSFSVKEGEIFVVMGLSGSGKSTLIRCINRLITPTSGKVYIDDEEILGASENRLRQIRRTKMAMVFQHFALLPHKTVIENVGYGLKLRGVEQDERRNIALEALDMVGLKPWAEKRPDNLSGGMKQRVGLARALATDADILLMDEAFGALDPLIRRQMQNELMQLQESLKKTVIFITHDLNEALRVGNHVMIMREGENVQIGTPVDIITKPADDYVAAFMADVDQSRVLTAEVVMQPAEYLELGRDAFQTAVKRFQDKDDASSFYVVNGQQKVEGLIRRQAVLHADKSGKRELHDVMDRDFPTAPQSAPLNELYALVSDGVPVAVTDAAGRLRGVVTAKDVLSSMATVEHIAEEAEQPTPGRADSSESNGAESNGTGNGKNGSLEESTVAAEAETSKES